MTARGRQIKRDAPVAGSRAVARKVAVVRCKGPQKGNAAQETGNELADAAVKPATERTESGTEAASLTPGGRVRQPTSGNCNKEDKKLIGDL